MITIGNFLEGIFDDSGVYQLVNEPPRYSGNSKTCIDLVITNQPNLINDCSIEPSDIEISRDNVYFKLPILQLATSKEFRIVLGTGRLSEN